MSIPIQVKRCSIFNEFTSEKQKEYFSITSKKTLHHIDTLYYAVYLNEPKEIINLQKENNLPSNLAQFLLTLRSMKMTLRCDPSSVIELGELEFSRKAFSIYEFCVSKNECFDIFISSYIPTEETPRILVQLRSRYLVLEGVKKATEESFAHVKQFLAPFGLYPIDVRENRIDYAYHTNLIQNPYKFFSDAHMIKHLKTNLRNFAKYGKIIEDGIELETLSLGNRKSNNIYWRGYNKCQEVIRKNYKAFFFQRWYDHHLISAFDKYVYEIAYEMKSYRTGCLVGRLRWYIAFGKNEVRKKEFEKLLESCYVKSDNNEQIAKKIRGVIPEPTLIFNIEFQTKRKFYTSCAEWFGFQTDLSEDYPEIEATQLIGEQIVAPSSTDPLLRKLFIILNSAPEILDYLTSYGHIVSFAKDRKMSMKDFIEEEEPYMDWWKKLRATPIEYASPAILELYRQYDTNISIEKAERNLQGQIARLAMLNRSSIEDHSFVEDMADVLSTLNDNDMKAFVINPEIFEQADKLPDLKQFDPKRYAETRQRRARQLKGIIKNNEEP